MEIEGDETTTHEHWSNAIVALMLHAAYCYPAPFDWLSCELLENVCDCYMRLHEITNFVELPRTRTPKHKKRLHHFPSMNQLRIAIVTAESLPPSAVRNALRRSKKKIDNEKWFPHWNTTCNQRPTWFTHATLEREWESDSNDHRNVYLDWLLLCERNQNGNDFKV